MLFNFFLVLSVLYVLASVVYLFLGLPYSGYVALSAAAPLLFLVMRGVESRRFIDVKLQKLLGPLNDYSVFTKSLPGYRFVDIYNAVVARASGPGQWTQFSSQHQESLAVIFTGQFYADRNRRMNPAENVARAIGEGKEGFFPTDSFWVSAQSPLGPGVVLRVRVNEYTHEVTLEVGAKEREYAEGLIEEILRHASEHSIYKNRMVEVSFAQEVKDAYGDIERHDKVDLIFLDKPPVTDDDIVLDDETMKILWRGVIDFHERRRELMAAGLPGRRGLLFYGPPGTGKTFTCRYLSHRIGSATTLVAAGLSLLHVKSVCNIARMLQPSIVILEDVDLVYSSREQNIYTTALGELMDELDGFGPEDHIIFLLTTNAIDRVEAAIRERPGRISQCVYFGAPSATLRRRYLESLLAPYDCLRLDMEELTASTEGVTQAFLKELVFRAVQIATESRSGAAPVALSNEDFREALAEMRSFAGRSGEAIIGFRVER